MKRGSSLRFIEWPMPQTFSLVLSCDMAGLLLQGSRCVLHGLDDVDVARAAAQVSRDRFADLQLGWLRIVRKQRRAGHQHAGRAEAALQAVLVPERLLDGVQLAVLLQAFDGGD